MLHSSNEFAARDFHVQGPPALSGDVPPVVQVDSVDTSIADRSNSSWRWLIRWLLSRDWLAALASFVVHLILILLLAVLAYHSQGISKSLSLNSGWSKEDQASATFDIQAPSKDEGQEPDDIADRSVLESRPNESSLTITDFPSLELEPSELPAPVVNPMLQAARSASSAPSLSEAFRSTNIETRNQANRAQQAASRGGNAQSEKAVEDALKWFAQHQLPNGGWSLHFHQEPCNGRCSEPGNLLDPHYASSTGLALLCFLGAGYTQQEGPYRKVVKDGLYFLTQIQRHSRYGAQFFSQSARYGMYEQGIATLALCEAYQMTHDPDLRGPCQNALDFIRYAQNNDGSWDYDPKKLPGDLSIACWQIMAFKSGLGGGLSIPIDSIQVFDAFLDSQASGGGSYYGYRDNDRRPGTTSMGLLMRMYRGWGKTDPRLMRGIQYLEELGPHKYDVYYNYYATQVLFHQDAGAWQRWNPKMRDMLIQTQSHQGHESGSWFFPGFPFNEIGGRLYCTALSTMTLEVYYRHMPIYEQLKVDEFMP